MNELDLWLMSAVIFVPTLFALGLLLFPRGSDEWMRWFSLLGTAVTLVLSLFLYIHFQNDVLGHNRADPSASQLSRRAEEDLSKRETGKPPPATDLVSRVPWISRFNIEYFLGVDGISMPLILLTTVICFLSMIASWNIEKHVRGYCMLFLLLETGIIGTFLALDFFLFYIFWEVMLLPMYFLIGVWGGPRREYAAVKFFLYTLFGSVLILIALLAFYFTDIRDFVHPETAKRARDEVIKRVEGTGPRLTPEQVATRIEPEAEVNSFDLLALHRAGVAARLALKQANDPALLKKVREDLQASKRLKDRSAAEADQLVREEAAWQARRNVARQILLENEKHYLDADQRKKLESGTADQKQVVRDFLNKRIDDKRVEATAKRLDQAFFSETFQVIMFVLLFVGFAIKVPVFPFHTWLPDAHVEAPTPISMILAGILLKLGGYGILRIAYPICPWAAEWLAWPLAIFGIINIVYGAFAAMAQTDFKKLVAYSSISHMGYVILGIAVWTSPERSQYWSWGMNGAMFQMIAHGITSAGMFFLVGVIYDRVHHRDLNAFRGLYEPMPMYGGVSAIIFFAAMGLPGMCGFVGEFMVILSTWNFTTPEFPNAGKVLAILAALTVILTAAYILWTVQRVYFGTNAKYKGETDINLRELLCVIPLVVLSVLLGVLPFLLLNMMEPHVTGLIESLAQVGR
jgi:NADH-quinone oxidoreductase subunit M